MKKFLLICTVIFISLIIGDTLKYRMSLDKISGFDKQSLDKEVDINSKIEGKQFYIEKESNWEPFEIRGINIGASKPGGFPNEFKITKEEYLRWFRYISELHVNTIRVYTILSPDFYEALYEFNLDNEKALYLLQGVWIDEEWMQSGQTAYENKLKTEFIKDAKIAVDVVHGKRKIAKNDRYAYGNYNKDISNYVLGYILGVEWESDFISYTDFIDEEKIGFKGEYLETVPLATPFESFLAEVGDAVIQYESNKYGEQRLLSYVNWPDTDPLQHQSESEKDGKIANINIDHIRANESFEPGLFATYHAYPYYPNFLDLSEEYKNYKDESGTINPYRAYLIRLNAFHKVPVFIGEYGVPSSRGMARVNESGGINEGRISEKEQGEIIVKLYQDIKASGCAGSSIFMWQDEWFQKSWNTKEYIDTKTTARWNDWQTSKQHFGLLAFDPGEDESISYVDNTIEEWQEYDVISKGENITLSMKSDEKFLYLLVEEQVNRENEKIYIALDITPKSGAMKASQFGLEFEKPTDFIIEISGEGNSRVYTHQYYNTFRFLYGKAALDIQPYELEVDHDVDKFEPIQLFLRTKVKQNNGEEELDPKIYETGKLYHGNSNPDAKDYQSLSDFYRGDGYIEIRIPWQLLNFMDPSSKRIQDDYYRTKGIMPLRIKQIYASAYIGEETSNWGSYTWDNWKVPKYHERLKQSYYIIQEAFSKEEEGKEE